MNSVARPIHILSQRSLEAENTIESLRGESLIHLGGETPKAQAPGSSRRDEVKAGPGRTIRPLFGEKVKLMATLSQGLNQTLDVELRSPHGGEPTSDQSKLHVRKT